jgi:hypothetical protein
MTKDRTEDLRGFKPKTLALSTHARNDLLHFLLIAWFYCPTVGTADYAITAVTLTKVSGKILFRLNQHHNLL